MKPFFACKMFVALVVSAGLWIPSASFAADDAVKTQVPDNAAVINGKAIPYADFQWELDLLKKRLEAQGRPIPEITAKLKSEVLDDMVMRELIFQESVKKSIQVDPKSIKDEISAIQLRLGDQQQFNAWLSAMHMSEDKLKEEISQRQAIKALIDKEIAPKVQVSEDDAKTFYKDHPKLFQRPEEVHAQHILIKVDKDADDQQKAQARKELLALKKRIDAGEDFGELAKTHSQGPSASKKGDLGFFSKGRMVPEFEKAAFGLQPGQVSDLVETQFGYHLIKVLEHRQAKTMTFKEVQPRIAANLRNLKIRSEVRQYAEKLRKDAKVETFVQ